MFAYKKCNMVMKRFTLIAVALCVCVLSFGQSAHLMFKGFPIDGSVETFVRNMQSVGYELIVEDGGRAMLRGDFAGSSDCIIMTAQNNSIDSIHSVAVCFSAQTSWSPLWHKYLFLKESLTKKYGKPTVCIEEFPIPSKTDEDKFFLLKHSGNNYVSSFEAPGGNVDLTIENLASFGCVVKLQYWDAINSAKLDKQALEDL